jgi:hypothetical protein
MSSILSSLKLVNAKRNNLTDPIIARRYKLCNKIKEQIALATAMQKGDTFTAKRLRRVRDLASGTSQVVEVAAKVKEWWFLQVAKLSCNYAMDQKSSLSTLKATKTA